MLPTTAITNAISDHYTCTVAGTSGATPPTWSDQPGSLVTDNTITWTTNVIRNRVAYPNVCRPTG